MLNNLVEHVMNHLGNINLLFRSAVER